jgi:hypothetical protein
MLARHLLGATIIVCLAFTTTVLGQETGTATPTPDDSQVITPGGEAGGQAAGTPVGDAPVPTPEAGTVITPGGEAGGQAAGTKVGSPQTSGCPQTAQSAQGADRSGKAPPQLAGTAAEPQC